MHWEIRVPGYLGTFIIGRGGDVRGIRSSGLLTVTAPRPSSQDDRSKLTSTIGDGLATGCAILTITEEAPSDDNTAEKTCRYAQTRRGILHVHVHHM